MRTESEIRELLEALEAESNEFEDLYEENFVAVGALRWILGLPPQEDFRDREED